jgi:hypothetical protein
MSQLKRDTSHFRFAHADKRSATQGIDHGIDQGIDESQPRQTLELQRAAALWQRSDGRGGDPYNAVGVRMQRSQAA